MGILVRLLIEALKYLERGGINDLSFGKVKGKSRYNLGKQAEIRERVKHTWTTK